MASAQKKARKQNPDTSTDDSSAEALSDSSTSFKNPCIICAKRASNNITKDHNYEGALQLYLCTLGIDIKPDVCRKCDLCPKCFEDIVKYYETNDITVYFENYFKSLRLNLLKKSLKGMARWERQGHPLTKIHQEISSKYGDQPDITEPEEEQIKQTLQGYEMEPFDILDSENEESDSRTGIRLSRAGGNGTTTAGTSNEAKTDKRPVKISLKNKEIHNNCSDSDDD